MITRPQGLEICEVSLTFNGAQFIGLEIDLQHINLGKKRTREQHLTIPAIVEVASRLIDFENLNSAMTKQYGDEHCDYFVRVGSVKSKKYKIVFCICSDRPNVLGILTLFRLRSQR